MPLYDYTCLNCDTQQQKIHKWNESPTPCTVCGSAELKKSLVMTARPRVDGLSSMSVRHTTSEYFGAHGHMGKEEYFPEERTRKAKEAKKKQDSKGATVAVKKTKQL